MKRALITGATRGIGRACAEAFVATGWHVTGIARSVDGFAERFPPGRATGIAVNLADAEARNRIPVGDFDVVVLNAAHFSPGPLLTGEDIFSQLLATNVTANHDLARTQVQGWLNGKATGHLVAIGSLGTDYWPDHLTAYVATKYGLRGLYEGWRRELTGTGIRCTLVAPGATLTSSWDDETPPDNILPPQAVAAVVLAAVTNGTEGRLTVEN